MAWLMSDAARSCPRGSGPAALATPDLEGIWIKNLTIGLVASRRFDTTPMVTHRFGLDEFETAYDVLANVAATGALKVLLTATRQP